MLKDLTLEKLKQLNIEELEALSDEVRGEIIQVVSNNGGHLASNLGVVELTIALHKVFDSPKDKIIFDVSHQSYTHKLLTGRADTFNTLRQFKGISGFTKYSESLHDAYEAGHSSTAISAGLGYLEAKEVNPNDIGEVIAVVGDASITNGLSFEALNYLGCKKSQKMIIILNDNEMGISKNVGSLAKSYNKIKTKGSLKFLRSITPITVKKALKSVFFENSLFHDLGFEYFEKIDGHNFKELIKYLNYAKNAKGSIVLHVMTKKGKGYAPSESDLSGAWHGVSPFNIETGEPKESSKGLTYGEILGNELINYVDNSEISEKIRVITPAMSLGSGLEKFARTHHRHFIDAGLAEENATLMASSMAHAGLVPVLFVYSTFLQRAYDELLHDIARCGEHVVICVDRAGIVSGDGDTHQGIFDLAYLSSIPGLTILSPSNSVEAKAMLKYALFKIDGPIVIRYPKQNIIDSNDLIEYSPTWKYLTKGEKCIITYGILLDEVKNWIDTNNINATLVNAHSIEPIDEETLIDIANNYSEVIVYEEVIENGSLGSKILNFYNKKGISTKVKLLNLDSTYLEVGTRSELMQEYHITLEDLKKVMDK